MRSAASLSVIVGRAWRQSCRWRLTFISIARALLLALAFLLAACGGNATSAGPPTLGTLVRGTPDAAPTRPTLPTTTPTASSIETPPAATIQAGAANILVTYHKSGGIAGIDETLTVYIDGRIEIQSRGGGASAQADPADIQKLQLLLASPEFAGLQPPVPPVAPDQFVYELTVPGRAQPIVTADGADNPPVLDQVIDTLEKLKIAAR